MQIVILPNREGDVIAREDQLGDFAGEFFIGSSGCVWYRHPANKQQWYVNRNVENFCRSAEAFNRYCEEVVTASGEAEQLKVVDGLREGLRQIEVLDDSAESFWAVILEQAEMGLL